MLLGVGLVGVCKRWYYSRRICNEFLWNVMPCSVLDKYRSLTNSAQTYQQFLHNTGVQNNMVSLSVIICMHSENVVSKSFDRMFDCTDGLYTVTQKNGNFWKIKKFPFFWVTLYLTHFTRLFSWQHVPTAVSIFIHQEDLNTEEVFLSHRQFQSHNARPGKVQYIIVSLLI
jgi:hypothetical protein